LRREVLAKIDNVAMRRELARHPRHVDEVIQTGASAKFNSTIVERIASASRVVEHERTTRPPPRALPARGRRARVHRYHALRKKIRHLWSVEQRRKLTVQQRMRRVKKGLEAVHPLIVDCDCHACLSENVRAGPNVRTAQLAAALPARVLAEMWREPSDPWSLQGVESDKRSVTQRERAFLLQYVAQAGYKRQLRDMRFNVKSQAVCFSSFAMCFGVHVDRLRSVVLRRRLCEPSPL